MINFPKGMSLNVSLLKLKKQTSLLKLKNQTSLLKKRMRFLSSRMNKIKNPSSNFLLYRTRIRKYIKNKMFKILQNLTNKLSNNLMRLSKKRIQLKSKRSKKSSLRNRSQSNLDKRNLMNQMNLNSKFVSWNNKSKFNFRKMNHSQKLTILICPQTLLHPIP